MKIKISEIIVKDRCRSLNNEKVKELSESIKEIGLINPITVSKTVDEEKPFLIAGNHRIEACKLLGFEEIECNFIERNHKNYTIDGLILELIEIDENLIRNELHFIDRGQHLNRRKEIYEMLYPETKKENNLQKVNTYDPETDSVSGQKSFVKDTSSKTGKSETVIREELQIAKNILPEVQEVIKQQDITKTDALKMARLDPEQQKKVAEKFNEGAKSFVDAKRLIKKDEVHEVPEVKGKYRIIYADCPWSYGDKLTDGYGTAENHYPTMSIQELCELPIKEMSEDNAVLFMWATSPLLEESFEVIKSWGFKYKTSFIWDKVKHNMGHYNSVRHELLLICTRGSCLPDNKKLYDSVVECERTDKHSEKPEVFRNIIDDLYQTGNRIELFARKKTDNWEVWGNQV